MNSKSPVSNSQVRALLLSAYHAQSHQVWAERVQELFSDWYWHCLSLPPRHFNWRIRSNGLQWAFEETKVLDQEWDLLIATSMVDLASLRSLVPALCSIPTIVYFHENQFAYPENNLTQSTFNVEPLLVPIYSALSADSVLFNSEFNRMTFLEGVRSLSQKFPEPIPKDALEQLDRSTVVPVPVTTSNQTGKSIHGKDPGLLEVIWNHRWEYDKGPDLLLAVVEETLKRTQSIRFHIVGQQFRQQPKEFQAIVQLLEQWSRTSGIEGGATGFLAEPDYRALLQSGDVVLSTAAHDFQGLSVQEGCIAGCSPLAPDALVYPEYLGPEFLYEVAEAPADTAETIASMLELRLALKQQGAELPLPDLSRYEGSAVRESYRKIFLEMEID